MRARESSLRITKIYSVSATKPSYTIMNHEMYCHFSEIVLRKHKNQSKFNLMEKAARNVNIQLRLTFLCDDSLLTSESTKIFQVPSSRIPNFKKKCSTFPSQMPINQNSYIIYRGPKIWLESICDGVRLYLQLLPQTHQTNSCKHFYNFIFLAGKKGTC